jgi:hypothetical protein
MYSFCLLSIYCPAIKPKPSLFIVLELTVTRCSARYHNTNNATLDVTHLTSGGLDERKSEIYFNSFLLRFLFGAFLCLFSFAFSFSLGLVSWILPAEIFPFRCVLAIVYEHDYSICIVLTRICECLCMCIMIIYVIYVCTFVGCTSMFIMTVIHCLCAH